MDFKLLSSEPLTQLLLSKKITTWNEAIKYVQRLPYGRNASRTNFALVITESKGSCSSKHAFLKSVADENGITGIKLCIGIYKMDQYNTPKTAQLLLKHAIAFIPEAHCYLKINGNYLDVTSTDACFDKIKDVILEEITIDPFQVGDFKIEYHQDFIKNWLKATRSTFSFEEFWKIREGCIGYLSA